MLGCQLSEPFVWKTVHLNRRKIWPITEQVSGTIVVEPDRIKFVDFNGVYDSLPVRLLQGLIFF